MAQRVAFERIGSGIGQLLVSKPGARLAARLGPAHLEGGVLVPSGTALHAEGGPAVPVRACDGLCDHRERAVSGAVPLEAAVVEHVHGVGLALPHPDQPGAGFDARADEGWLEPALTRAAAISRSLRFVAAERPPKAF